MTVTAEWRAVLNAGTELGAGTDYIIDEDGIGGLLGLPALRTDDNPRGDLDGDTAAPDRYGRRVLTIPVTIVGDTPGDVMANLATLKADWLRVDTTDELPLEVRLPGFPGAANTLTYYGRPRGFEVDPRGLKAGALRSLLTFEALDPLGYEPVDNDEEVASPFTLTNNGNETTDRLIIAVLGDGGTPNITNTTEGGEVYWSAPLGVGEVRIVYFRTRDVTDDVGSNVFNELGAGSSWFRLLPGANTIEFSGFSYCTWTVESAHA